MTECLDALDGLVENPAVPMRDRLGIALRVARQRRDLILDAVARHENCLDDCLLGKEIREILGVADDE